jgi:hypothetical protein
MSQMADEISRLTNQAQASAYYTDYMGIISVLSYANGAIIQNGSTSAVAAINLAIADLPTNGGVIFFPSTSSGSTYLMDSNITFPANCTLWFADGARLTGTATITGAATKIKAGLHYIFATTLTFAGTWKLEEVFPEWFGAIPDNTTICTNAIFACFKLSYLAGKFHTNSNTGFSFTSGQNCTVVFQTGTYLIDDEISLYTEYFNLKGVKDGTFVRQSSTTKRIFYRSSTVEGSGGGGTHRAKVSGIVFVGGTNQLYITNGNIDTSKITIRDCLFESNVAGNYAIYYYCVSDVLLIENCDCHNTPRFLDVKADKAIINNCWINGWATGTNLKPNNSSSIKNRAGNLTFNDCILIPEGDGAGTSSGTRWVDNYSRVAFNNCLFGSENGGLPIVWNYAAPYYNTNRAVTSSAIIFKNCQTPCAPNHLSNSGVIVFKDHVPQLISIEDCYNILDGYIINATKMTDAISLTTYLATYLHPAYYDSPKISIKIKNTSWAGAYLSNPVIPAELDPYIEKEDFFRGNKTTYFNYLDIERITNLNKLVGNNLAQTSAGIGTSIIDTSIYADEIRSGVYLVSVSGNPNDAGSGLYRDIIVASISVSVGFNVTVVSCVEVVKLLEATPAGAVGALDIAVTWWDGASESAESDITEHNKLRIKISGYTGTVGANQEVNLIKLI